jgi:hypothetical protein
MLPDLFLILLCGHILGDFYLQTKVMAEKKEKSLKWVILHGIFYFATCFFVLLPVFSRTLGLVVIMMGLIHLFIDIIKFSVLNLFTKKNKKSYGIERNAFFIDQVYHIITLLVICYWFVTTNKQINFYIPLNEILQMFQVNGMYLLRWILALLLIHKPANIIIQKLLIIYKPENKDMDVKIDNKAGRFIGTLERILMLIFLFRGEYAAIGFVLTAKSIARYDRISKEKDFAEYYLLGTLLSTIIVIVVSFILA